tara:strand:- start:481 stop:714 length:234 start_codon:yes stop_codon:yes gene_type:complete
LTGFFYAGHVLFDASAIELFGAMLADPLALTIFSFAQAAQGNQEMRTYGSQRVSISGHDLVSSRGVYRAVEVAQQER